jgi:Ni,Fe-hydrogenase I small subunit
MNASGGDIGGTAFDALAIADPLHLAQQLLGGTNPSYAEWSTETKAEGQESIKLHIANRELPAEYAQAIITPIAPILVNEFSVYFKYKTSENQAPYVELSLRNPDTDETATVTSNYPGVLGGPFPGVNVLGPTDWKHVTMADLVWTDDLPSGFPPDTIPGSLLPQPPYPAIYGPWADIKNLYPAYLVDAVKIVSRGSALLASISGGFPTAPCTIYIDEIMVGGIHYQDESDSIVLDPPASVSPFVFCIEGSVQTGTPAHGTQGQFCQVGAMVGDTNETFLHAFLEYSRRAAVVLAVGTCASYGGIPGARGSVTGIKPAKSVLQSYGITTPVINIPGCPAHPDWVIGTIAQILAELPAGLPAVLGALQLDSKGRPIDYYQEYVCNGNVDTPCPWRFNNDRYDAGAPAQDHCASGKGACSDDTADDPAYGLGQSRGLAKYKWGAVSEAAGINYPKNKQPIGGPLQKTNYPQGTTFEGCLGVLGCRGRKTKADCAARKWNSPAQFTYGVNWCVGSRGGCQGCTDPSFPSNARFYTFR